MQTSKKEFHLGSSTKRAMSCFLTFFILLILPVWGSDTSKDEETISNAATVLQGMLSDDKVPADLLAKANCVIILPSVKKFGFGIGGSGGRGPMSCRQGKGFTGMWSPPAMYTIGGASFGLQAGGSATDFVLLVMADKGVNALLDGKTKLGHDATAAAGPSGVTSMGSVGGADILTYGRASGLFAGMSLGGATLQPDDEANTRLYGKAVTAREIVLGNTVKTPTGCQPLVSLLNTKIAKHTS
jgi:lipid-binding SYLF domain-containing protein